MKAGKLRKLLIPYVPERVTDPKTGAERTDWKTSDVIYAERVRHTASERVENHELFTDYHAEYRLRIQHRLKEKMRVRDISTSTLYNIVGAFPDPENEMLRITCERVNE